MVLRDGSRVAVVGGGPAGSFSAYFLLTLARALDVDLRVDIYEPRAFDVPGPAGCNMCGGIVSDSLVQDLAADGLALPPTVVQRTIVSYVLTTDEGSVRIDMPAREKQIAALHRGGGPRGIAEMKWQGLDGYLLGRAKTAGAQVIPQRVDGLERQDGLPVVSARGRRMPYDLLVGATGVNTTAWRLYQQLGIPAPQPRITRAYITELPMDHDEITRCVGEAMHIFLLRIAGLEFAAIIPKGDVLTICLLGKDIDRTMVDAFFASAPVRQCLRVERSAAESVCRCTPSINIGAAPQPYADRFVLVGDAGVTRLYKDGIGAAYRTAKAAAVTAMFCGVSAATFARYYWPLYRSVEDDNRFGRLLFLGARRFTSIPPLLRGVLTTVAREQAAGHTAGQPMSHVLWDLFAGSAPYRDIFVRALDLSLLRPFARDSLRAAFGTSLDDPLKSPPADVRRWDA